MRVLGFGTYDITRHPRVGIVLDGLRDLGDDVTEINRPLGLSTADRVAMLQRPWLVGGLVVRLLACWWELVVDARRQRRRAIDLVVVGYLGHFDVLLARLLFPRVTVALDMMIFAADTAHDRGVSGGVRLRLLSALDRMAVRCADIVLLDTDEQTELMRPGARHKAVVVPVGAPTAWFDAGAGAVRPVEGPLRAVFFGLYTPLQGAATIGDALALLADRADIQVTMVGAGQDLLATRAAAAANTHVTWLDWVEHNRLPALAASHHVCLGIFGSTDKAQRVVPNKVYQGAAVGCTVLTSDTAPQRRTLGEHAVFVPAGDAAALSAALAGLADDRALTGGLGHASRRRALERFTPAAVVGPLRAHLAR